MSTDDSSPLDWNRYRELKAEGRLNILFRLSEPPCVSMLGRNELPVSNNRPNVILIVSRAEQLAWREQWKRRRWVRLSWPPHEREAILRQDAIFREQDARWALRHGPIEHGARVLSLMIQQIGWLDDESQKGERA